MEIIKNKYGAERVIEKIGSNTLRVMEESIISRISESEEGVLSMFDFEGGPCLTVGGNIKFLQTIWTITSIVQEKEKHEGLDSVRIGIKL